MNATAVLIDHSRSMGIADDGKPRLQAAEGVLNNQLLPELSKRFQVRLYQFGKDASRIERARNLSADDNATRIGDSLKHIAAEAGTMPLGAIVLMTDGGDNTGSFVAHDDGRDAAAGGAIVAVNVAAADAARGNSNQDFISGWSRSGNIGNF